jgi:Rrf2 family transcriptional regulator, iron-sulfur cluster assembly transcription factor
MIALSSTTGYAIKAMSCFESGVCPSAHIADIACCSGVPAPYLAKIVRLLSRHGLVATRRGYRGGIRPTRPLRQISLLDVVRAVEGEEWIGRCLLGLEDCGRPEACPMHGFWTRVRGEIEGELRRLTLEDFMHSPCEVATARPQQDGSSSRSGRPNRTQRRLNVSVVSTVNKTDLHET